MSEKAMSHNRLAAKFVREMLVDALSTGGDDSAVMVVLESVVLGGLLANERLFNVSRRATVELLESLTMAVQDRLAAEARKP